jgi:hypothetical protein
MVSLHDLRTDGVALDWHEAVAAGAALATSLAEAHAPSCPHPADVAVLPSGDLRVTGGGHLDGSAAAGVAQVLIDLLDATPHPAELRQAIDVALHDRRTGPDAVAAVRELVAALAFFELPSRRGVLAVVAQRAEPIVAQARRAAALEALTERTRLAAASGDAAGTNVTSDHGRSEPAVLEADAAAAAPEDDAGGEDRLRLIVPAAVAVVAFVAVAFVAGAWFDRPAAPPTVAEDAGEPAPPPAAPPAAAPHPRVPATGRAERPGAETRPVQSAASPAPVRVSPAPASDPTPDAPAKAARSVDVVVAERDGRVVPSPVAPSRSPAPRPEPDGRIFESGDAHVVPALLIRPQLPDDPPPGVPEEQIGTLEFVVAPSGAVEHVHLVSPANRYQERMLVAAAKTWRFRPATHDGKPVRYRTRIRVTL